ncbi:MAG: gliding motility lipoprotein GldH [Muribaculaceae bacterium]|nr:gliding motility lipoprotein GldH [Muribaculaceae bacterium]
MKRTEIYIFSLLSIILIGMTSCRKDIEWSQTQNIGSDEWSRYNPLCFNLDPVAFRSPYKDEFDRRTAEAIGDTVARLHGQYSSRLSLRYTGECNAEYIDVVVVREALEGETVCDTIRYPLFSPTGIPLGRGRYGMYEVSLSLPSPYIAHTGGIISVYPLEYDTPVRGIKSATLILCRPGINL